MRVATPDDRSAVVDTIAAAFVDDAAFNYFFEAPSFARDVRAFAGYLFDARVGLGSVWLTAAGDAVALWDPPRKSGQVDDPHKAALFAAADLGEAAGRIDAYNEPIEEAFPATPHWYLGILASHPERRGQGLARVVAKAGLAEASQADVPAFLETTTPANVDIYRRAGWAVHAHLEDVCGLPVWVLRHDG